MSRESSHFVWLLVPSELIEEKSPRSISDSFCSLNLYNKDVKVKLQSMEFNKSFTFGKVKLNLNESTRKQLDADESIRLFYSSNLPIFDDLKIVYCPKCFSLDLDHNQRQCSKVFCIKCGKSENPFIHCQNDDDKRCLFCRSKGHSTFDLNCSRLRALILNYIDSSKFGFKKLFLHLDYLPQYQRNIDNQCFRTKSFGPKTFRVSIQIDKLRESVHSDLRKAAMAREKCIFNRNIVEATESDQEEQSKKERKSSGDTKTSKSDISKKVLKILATKFLRNPRGITNSSESDSDSTSESDCPPLVEDRPRFGFLG